MNNIDFILENEQEIGRTFLSKVDPSVRTREEQKLWWNQFHIPRSQEVEKFREFINSNSFSICQLSGQAGTGKTTFLLDKYENPKNRLYNGIWVDIGQHSSELEEVETLARVDYLENKRDLANVTMSQWIYKFISKKISKIISKEIERRFKSHFWRLKCGLDEKYFDIDIENKIEIDYEEPSQDQFESYAAEVSRNIEAALILVRPDNYSINIREKAVGYKNIRRYEKLQKIANYLRENSEVRPVVNDSELNNAELVVSWFRAYLAFFSSDYPVVLVIDNVDRVYSQNLHGAVVDYVRQLAGELRKRRLIGKVRQGSKKQHYSIKIVYAIRNWNNHSNTPVAIGGTAGELPLVLGDEEGSFVYNDNFPCYIPLSSKTLENIMIRRLEAVKIKLRKNILEKGRNKLLTEQFINDSFEKLNQLLNSIWYFVDDRFEKLSLIEITNYSIDKAIETSFLVSFEMLKRAKEMKINLGQIIDLDYRFFARPVIVSCLFSSSSGLNVDRLIKSESDLVKAENEGDMCCSHRLILTYLDSIRKKKYASEKYTTVKKLSDHLLDYASVSEERTKNALFYLFKSKEYEAEYVTIYQPNLIVEPNMILDDAIIHINPKGTALVRRILHRMECWSRFNDSSDNLFELLPNEAVNYVSPILDLIISTANVHLANWKNITKNNFSLVNNQKPIKYFEDKNLTIGNSFYLQRVANSHMHSLIAYFRLIFQDEGLKLCVSSEKLESLKNDWPSLGESSGLEWFSDSTNLDQPIKKYKNIISSEQALIIDSLCAVTREFDNIHRKFKKLSNFSYVDFLEESKGLRELKF